MATQIFKNRCYGRRVPVKAADPKFLKSLGERLTQARKARGLTQNDLADLVGVKQYVVASYETGRNQMPISLVHPLAEALEISVAELLGEVTLEKRRGPVPKLQRQFEAISELPQADQRFFSQMVERFIKESSKVSA